MSMPVEEGKAEKREHEVTYYQWIPMILSIQALLFYGPRLIWRRCYQATGIDIDGLVISLSNFDTIVTPDSREKMFLFLAKYIDKYLTSQRDGKTSCINRVKFQLSRYLFIFCSHRYGNILSTMYLAIKMGYCINIVLQMAFLNLWMGPGYYMYGVHVMGDILRQVDWTGTWRFPRITLCDFEIRALGRNTFIDHY
ncbi:innexin unc-9-like [Convolutriloba macropyga]|uniref:innexin unc-9-like n=1 Tax=Convolutriloba macropyga TaxID=536237 RepID=UPI003F51DC8D